MKSKGLLGTLGVLGATAAGIFYKDKIVKAFKGNAEPVEGDVQPTPKDAVRRVRSVGLPGSGL
jgi:hypothetical protein